MKLLVYLVGPPGSGKSTTIRRLADGYTRRPADAGHLPIVLLERQPGHGHPHLPDHMIEIGRDRDDFSGTDALAMNIQAAAVNAMQTSLDGLVLAEGDRLANDGFLQASEEAGWAVRVIYMATRLTECAARRDERGSHQNEAWVKGRVTKSRTLASRWGGSPLDGHRPPETVAADLAEMIGRWMAG